MTRLLTVLHRFLAFKRCSILATVVLVKIIDGESPSQTTLVSCLLVTAGAFIAGYETIEKDLAGFILVWANNFLQSFQNIYFKNLEQRRVITSFGKQIKFLIHIMSHNDLNLFVLEMSFYFGFVSLVLSMVYNSLFTENMLLLAN